MSLLSISTNCRNPLSLLEAGGLGAALVAMAMLEPITTTGFSSLLNSSLNSWNLKGEIQCNAVSPVGCYVRLNRKQPWPNSRAANSVQETTAILCKETAIRM